MARFATKATGGARAALAGIVALAAAAAVASCTDKNAGPTWTGSFTSAITSCGGSLVSAALDPPIEMTIESEGDFEVGRSVALYPDGDCGFVGEIAADGSLHAEMYTGCVAYAQLRSAITIRDVFAARTEIRQTTDYLDPQSCDVEAWGTFERD